MHFQASEYKRRNFLDLNNNDNQPIWPIYTKGSAWLKYFGSLNSIYACITRLVTNHAPISNIVLGSFPKNLLLVCVKNIPLK